MKKTIVVLIAILASGLGCVHSQSLSRPNPTGWEEAETRWELFAGEHTQRMRYLEARTPAAKLPDYKFDRKWLEIKHPLISKYLPDYRIYTDRYHTYALRKDGRITNIEATWPSEIPYYPGGVPYYTVPDLEIKDYSHFIKDFGIQVKKEETAIEMISLGRIVYSHGYSTEEYAPNWKFEASRSGATWTVSLRYVGAQEVCISPPPYWGIEVDEQNRIRRILEKINSDERDF